MEDYKEKYEEAIARMNKWVEGSEITDPKEIAEFIFPELAESENEKMRKHIIRILQQIVPDPETYHKEIAWLEKQGEQPNKVSIWRHWKDGIAGNGKDKLVFLIKNGDTYSLSSCLGYECDYIELSELDKLLSEKKCEQKPTDKVEPKFKVGDWITNGATNPTQISSIKNGMYFTHNDTIGGDIEFIDKEYHLWTIQDAKDGDVLVYEDEIFIAKSISDLSIVYHCCYDGKNFIQHSIYSLTKDDFNKIHPATKEQRDLLFQKMKEAGYEWDAKKRELKKIEQVPAAYFYCKYGGTISKCNDCKRNHLNSKYKTEEIETWMAPALHSTKQCSDYIQQNSVKWSEEDESILNDIMHNIHFAETHRNVTGSSAMEKEQVDWLKSLKERYTWKPSEEQVKALKEACDKHWELDGLDLLYTLLEQLKSI